MKIYVYDTWNNRTVSWGIRFMDRLTGMRYMALVGGKWPHGTIGGYGRTPMQAETKALDAYRPNHMRYDDGDIAHESEWL